MSSFFDVLRLIHEYRDDDSRKLYELNQRIANLEASTKVQKLNNSSDVRDLAHFEKKTDQDIKDLNHRFDVLMDWVKCQVTVIKDYYANLEKDFIKEVTRLEGLIGGEKITTAKIDITPRCFTRLDPQELERRCANHLLYSLGPWEFKWKDYSCLVFQKDSMFHVERRFKSCNSLVGFAQAENVRQAIDLICRWVDI